MAGSRTDYSNAYYGVKTSNANGSRGTALAEARSRGFDPDTKQYVPVAAAEELEQPNKDYSGASGSGQSGGTSRTDPGTGLWLRENHIVANSQPWIKATFNPFSSNIKDRAIAYRTEITAAEFECPTNMDTTGSITIIDPNGVWPSRLTRVGALMNSIKDAGKPNIKIEFGWKGLDYGSGNRGNSKIRSITAMVLDVNFDISDTGVTTAKVNFVQTPYVSLDLVRIIDPNDIQAIKLWSEEDNDWKVGPVSYRLNKLCRWDNGLQLGDQLKELNLRLIFEPTDDSIQDYRAAGKNYTATSNAFRIRYGDKLDTIISAATAKAKRLSDDDSADVSWIYGRMDAPIFSGSSDSTEVPEQILTYKWTQVPNATNADPDTDSFPEVTSAGMPILAWKLAISPAEGKQLLEWTSDLSSFYKILLQAQDVFDEKLSQFSDKDWNTITDSMEEEGSKFVSDGKFWDFLFKKKAAERTAMKEEFDETIKQYNKEIQGQAGNQLAAAIAQNVFKGNAKIMGDPSIGTDYRSYRSKFHMNFDAVGRFASLFSRDWVLTKAKHIFGDGSYTTEMEMMCYPIGKDKIPESDEIAAANYESGASNGL